MSETQTDEPGVVNLADLDLKSLSEIKKQLDEELTHFTNSFAQLKQAQAKFLSCVDNIKEVKPENKDKTILVPLTNSLYVPGKLCDLEHVLVDVGTGYFVKKTRQQGIKYYSAKVDFVKGNLENLEEVIQKKRDHITIVVNIMQSKLQAEASKGSRS